MSKQSSYSNNVWRVHLLLVLIVSAACFLAWRALNIQIIDNQFLQAQGDARHLRVISLPAHRGMILDRNGEALAISTPVNSVWADPQSVDLQHPELPALAKIIGKSVSKLQQLLKSKQNKEFVYLKRQVNPSIAKEIQDLDIPGIALQREFKRYYPQGEVSAHVVGFNNIDDAGQEGVELAFDTRLSAYPGKQRVVKDRLGRVIRAVDLIEEALPGVDVTLSIDRRLQYIAYRELKSAVQQHKAKSGSLVMLDVHTGEVLAMVNQPAYNPNDRQQLKSHLYRNRAVTDVFEPGSTMKPFLVAAALKSGKYKPDTLINTSPGRFRVGSNTISDIRDYGVIDVSRIIQKSSNIGVSKMALDLAPQVLWETYSDFGFGEYSGSSFPGESAGSLPFFSVWEKIDQATIAYGYGMAVTPLQLAQAYSTIANGGILREVTFLKSIDIPEGRRVLAQHISLEIMQMLELVVSKEGTAILAAVEGYRVGGKTGTVKKIANGVYLDKTYVSIFAGVAPISNPRFSMVVLLDEPGTKEYYGGIVAAPVFAKVMTAALRLQNVPPDDVTTDTLRLANVDEHL